MLVLSRRLKQAVTRMRLGRVLVPVFLFLSGVKTTLAVAAPGNWTGNYLPCDRHSELLNHSHMELAVRFSTSDRRLEAEFASALDFWATVLDMEWHREDSRGCSLAVVEGNRGMFEPGQVARAQFPNTPSFQGWIAFNPKFAPDRGEQYFMAVHELGHVFGLAHNPSPSSVMYFLYVGAPMFLDEGDLQALAAHHKLRGTVPIGQERRSVPVLFEQWNTAEGIDGMTAGHAPARRPSL